jgi:phosphate transport system permease protein
MLMPVPYALLALAALGVLTLFLGRQRAISVSGGDIRRLHSLPYFHGTLTMIVAVCGAVLGWIAFALLGQPGGMIGQVALMALPAIGGAGYVLSRIKPELWARNATETFVMGLLIACSMVAVLTTAGIVLSMVFETYHFFQLHSAANFFFSTEWNPQFRGGSSLGILPLVWGTLYVFRLA